ncbi:hypothetical protein WMF20_21515 [Sorangium sp. So ce834]|uniref:hypothetical protein n=1 Tax=Sorangium sp. So ce834 TaxID=3133321 RepID=UPI003F6462FF
MTRKGAGVPIALSASTLRGPKDELLGLVLVARDITAQKRAEEERERLEAAVRRQARMLPARGALTAGRLRDRRGSGTAHAMISPS